MYITHENETFYKTWLIHDAQGVLIPVTDITSVQFIIRKSPDSPVVVASAEGVVGTQPGEISVTIPSVPLSAGMYYSQLIVATSGKFGTQVVEDDYFVVLTAVIEEEPEE